MIQNKWRLLPPLRCALVEAGAASMKNTIYAFSAKTRHIYVMDVGVLRYRWRTWALRCEAWYPLSWINAVSVTWKEGEILLFGGKALVQQSLSLEMKIEKEAN